MYGESTENRANKIVEAEAIKKYNLYRFAKDISLEKISKSKALPDFSTKI